jgi:phosphocarrier protein
LLCQENIRLKNRLGLRLKTLAELVKIASQYHSRIKIGYGPIEVNGKNLLALLTLSFSYGMKVTLSAEGEDAQEALDAIKQFLKSQFGEVG